MPTLLPPNLQFSILNSQFSILKSMCGRFTLTKTKEQIIDYLSSLSVPVDNLDSFSPSYNIAPTQKVMTIVSVDNQLSCRWQRWGLIPKWTKKASKTNPLINARMETLSQKPSFKDAFIHRRCLILADGFYEWNRHSYGKNPLYFHLPNQELFAFASLWESWQNSEGKTINSATIINTSAQGVMEEIHPRMPVILSPSVYQQWLNPQLNSPSDLSLLLQNTQQNFTYYPVSQQVNFVKNNYPDLLKKETLKRTQQLSLFE